MKVNKYTVGTKALSTEQRALGTEHSALLRLPEKGTNGRAYLKVNKYTVGTKALSTEHWADESC